MRHLVQQWPSSQPAAMRKNQLSPVSQLRGKQTTAVRCPSSVGVAALWWIRCVCVAPDLRVRT